MAQERNKKPEAAGAGASRALVLVGFMGAGKTTTGWELAKRLHWRFLDLDDVVEKRERRSVRDLFRESEAAFRQAESSALEAVLREIGSRPTVLALGGGAYVQPDNVARIREAGLPVVFLDAPVEELRRRCAPNAATRPLFANEDQFRRLYQQRREAYLLADFSINTAAKTPSAVADELIALLTLTT